MDQHGNSSTPPQPRPQPSIRSFFQPRSSPSYTAPPAPASPLPTSAPRPSPIPTTVYSPPPSQTPSRTSYATTKVPSHASIALIQEEHIQSLRRINALLLPIGYPDSFYHTIAAPNPLPSFSRIITWTEPGPPTKEQVIGGAVCRLEPTPTPESSLSKPEFVPGCHDLYIQSLALLSPYRGQGLAAAVLQDIIKSAASTSISTNGVKVVEIYAHVWTENTEALEWYAKRGFKREENVVQDYYRKLKPHTAWILRRRIVPSDHLQSQSSTPYTSSSGPAVPLNTTAGTGSQTSAPKETASEKENRPSLPTPTRSFQDRGPEREWNDLPEDVLAGSLLKSASHLASAEASGTSSRSSSRGASGGKKKRVYPAAAFGS
ncbi:hypothetical protein HYALB_00008587 [Hymenoscyphus albidus]|uniref:N-acetyltransferase domain-containing protein n=1 Tax=Hymenoscyphus albidus TaxID=595503 RepID=A0A9N9LDB1_9HELO|nr:hypothetical protein HYALB_00008587 [Hymenoscyphus albidus]